MLSSFSDVRNKAQRLKNSGAVHILTLEPTFVAAKVEGDHNVYDTQVWRQDPQSWAVSLWDCTCAWDTYAWGRQPKFKKLEGRMCSHALATLYDAHGREYRKDSPDKSPTAPRAARKIRSAKDDDWESNTNWDNWEEEFDQWSREQDEKDKENRDTLVNLKSQPKKKKKYKPEPKPAPIIPQFVRTDNPKGQAPVTVKKIPVEDKAQGLKDYEEWWHQKNKQKTKRKLLPNFFKPKPPEPKWHPKYNQDFEYGFDYDKKAFGPDAHRFILAPLHNLMQKYPVTKDWFKGVRASDYNEHAIGVPCVVGDGHMWLPTPMVSHAHQGTYYTVSHEFGHALHAAITDKEQPGGAPPFNFDDLLRGKDPRDPEKDIMKLYNDDDNPIHRLIEHTKAKYPESKHYPSAYAQKNNLEMFAESMRDWWTSKKPSPVSQEVGRYVDYLYHKDSPLNDTEKTAALKKFAAYWLSHLQHPE